VAGQRPVSEGGEVSVRLCYVNITSEDTSGPFLGILSDYLPRVTRPDTSVTVRSVSGGLSRALDLRYTYLSFRNKAAIVDTIMGAEQDGFDAVTVGCFEDPAIREARSIVRIPVVGMGEATMHLACQLGDSFAVVTSHDRKIHAEIARLIKGYGLEARTGPHAIHGISMSDAGLYTIGMRDPGRVADDVLRQAEECVAGGADVVVVGCNAIGPLCTLSGVVQTEYGTAPILDCVAVAIKTAEAIADLCKRTGVPPVSRAGGYALPREKDLLRIRQAKRLAT
jgi:Asp/Glu/hydantoin racemase